MEHIHLLVSTFDTSNDAVAHNLRSCSRPPSETKTKTRQAETKTETKTREATTKTKTSRVETKTKTKTSKKWAWSVSRPRPGLETHIHAPTFSLNALCTDYLVREGVDDSRVAEHHRHGRQQQFEEKDGRDDGLLCGVAAVGAPWHTRSRDDVRALAAHRCPVRLQEDPDGGDCSIHQTLLNDELHKPIVTFITKVVSAR